MPDFAFSALLQSLPFLVTGIFARSAWTEAKKAELHPTDALAVFLLGIPAWHSAWSSGNWNAWIWWSLGCFAIRQTCSWLIGANRNYCYSTKVSEEIRKGAPATLCSAIPDAQTKTACEQKASGTANKSILDQAIATKNPALCDQIALETDRDLCKKIVASWK